MKIERKGYLIRASNLAQGGYIEKQSVETQLLFDILQELKELNKPWYKKLMR